MENIQVDLQCRIIRREFFFVVEKKVITSDVDLVCI